MSPSVHCSDGSGALVYIPQDDTRSFITALQPVTYCGREGVARTLFDFLIRLDLEHGMMTLV
jgi:hypothetical protein